MSKTIPILEDHDNSKCIGHIKPEFCESLVGNGSHHLEIGYKENKDGSTELLEISLCKGPKPKGK